VVIDLARSAVAQGEAEGDPVLLGACLVGLFLQTAAFVQYGRLPGPLAFHTTAVVETAWRVLAGAQTGVSQRR
jgi:hypothetical protein